MKAGMGGHRRREEERKASRAFTNVKRSGVVEGGCRQAGESPRRRWSSPSAYGTHPRRYHPPLFLRNHNKNYFIRHLLPPPARIGQDLPRYGSRRSDKGLSRGLSRMHFARQATANSQRARARHSTHTPVHDTPPCASSKRPCPGNLSHNACLATDPGWPATAQE